MNRAVAAPSRARKLNAAAEAPAEHVKLNEEQKKARNAARMRCLRSGLANEAASAAALSFVLYGTPLPIGDAAPVVAKGRRAVKVAAPAAPARGARRSSAAAVASAVKAPRSARKAVAAAAPALPARARTGAAAVAAAAVLDNDKGRFILTDMRTGDTIVKEDAESVIELLRTLA